MIAISEALRRCHLSVNHSNILADVHSVGGDIWKIPDLWRPGEGRLQGGNKFKRKAL